MIEERIDNQPQGNDEQKPKTEPSLIEFEGTVEPETTATQQVEEVSEAPKKPLTHAEKMNKLKEMKAKKEAEYKEKQKAEKLRLKELKNAERAVGGGRKINFKIIIPIVVLLLLVGVFAFIYFKKPDLLKKILPGKNKANTEVVKTDSSSNVTELSQADELSEESNDTTQQIAQPEAEPQAELAQIESAPVSEPVEVAPKAKKKSTSNESNIGKGHIISGPCWIVSFSSVADEKIASKGVKKLVDNGFLAGYYWMPDVDASAKQLFKVYSGPYSSEAEARSKQREIAVINPDAYVIKLDK